MANKSSAFSDRAAKLASDAADAVSRRQFLAWLGVGATAVAAGPLLSGCASTQDAVASTDAVDARDLQFRIPNLPPEITNLVLSVQGKHYPIQAHSALTKSKVRNAHPLGSQIDQSKLTHFASKVAIPANCPVEFMIWGTDSRALNKGMPVAAEVSWQTPANSLGVPAQTKVLGQEPGSVYIGGGICSPMAALRSVYEAAATVKPINEVFKTDVRLKAWGIVEPPANADEAVALDDLHDIPTSVATKLAFKYPGVTNMSSKGSVIATSIITSNQQLTGLSDAVETMLTNMGVYGSTEPQIADASGAPVFVSLTGGAGTGPQANVFTPFTQDGSTYQGQPIPNEWTSALRNNIRLAGQTASNQIQDAVALQQTSASLAQGDGGNWILSEGATPQVVEKTDADKLVAASNGKPILGSPQATYTVEPKGFNNQLRVDINGDPTPAKGQDGKVVGVNVPIRIYNNNEAFFDLYGQLWAGTKQVNLGDKQIHDDDYSIKLGSVPTVTVMMGIPLFDTNWNDFAFPIVGEATEGRALMCTLGSGTSWKSSFLDSKGNQLYSGAVHPDECFMPTIFTSIANLGIPFIMMIADAVALGNIYKLSAEAFEDVSEQAAAEIKQVIQAFSAVTGLSVLVNTLLGTVGGQEQAANGGWGSGSFMQWVGPLAKIVMTLLTKKLFEAMAEAMLADEVSEKVADAIPIVGEVFAVLCEAADIATLATAVGEVLSNPWVTPFRILGTYTSGVKVIQSPLDSSFPKTATNWKLTPIIEGGSTLTSIVNSKFDWKDPSLAPGYFVQQIPDVPVGSRIQWTVTFWDKNGWVVGIGSSPWYDNFDPTNLPSPTITIKELEPPLSKDSSYDLNATTQWDPNRQGGAGVTWSAQTTVPGTITDQTTVSGPTALPAAGNLAVTTIVGTAGLVYKTQKGWKVAQVGTTADPNRNTLALPGTYQQQPVLVYDSMSTDPANGHHYLLEPYDTTGGYVVRQLDLTKPGFGLKTLGQDEVEVVGRFPAELHGAVFHPAGYIVGFNTNTGRLQTLALNNAPVTLSPNPSVVQLTDVPSAIMTAGTGNLTGDRPGLVQQPVAVAAGLNGIVLVLEQGSKRVQAFNHIGAPTQYFSGSDGSLTYYLDLAKDSPLDHYSSLGVDGVGFVYVYGYTGAGTSPDQYGVSVFNAQGEVVVPFAAKVNGAAMTVDYWRNVYTQDFVPMQQVGGGAYLGNDGVAQPALSIWIPDTPAPQATQGITQ